MTSTDVFNLSFSIERLAATLVLSFEFSLILSEAVARAIEPLA